MLETIAIALIAFWLLGLVSSYTMGGFVHILLVIAIAAILIRIIQCRRICSPDPAAAGPCSPAAQCGG